MAQRVYNMTTRSTGMREYGKLRQRAMIGRTLEATQAKCSSCAKTHKSHLHLHHASSCGHTVHCEHTGKEIVHFHCNSDCPGGFLQILGQSTLSGGHMMPLDTQVVGTQQWHQQYSINHHTLCASGQNTISQLYPLWLHCHWQDVDLQLRNLMQYLWQRAQRNLTNLIYTMVNQ